MYKTTNYRTVILEVFQDDESKAWFYAFGFHWVIYRPSHGFPTYRDAREAGEEHIDQLFKEHSVEIGPEYTSFRASLPRKNQPGNE